VRIRTLPLLLVAGTSFAYLLAYPLAIGRADESHLLYGARRILDGEVIYRDFFEILTPLAFYLFAAIYRLAGTTLLAARVGMAIINAAACALLFHLARRLSGVAEATLATLIVACICLPTWPYASAHWISTALGLLIASVTLARADGWASSRVRPLGAGILAGVAICVQQQRGVFLATWLPLALWVLSRPLATATRWRTLGAQLASCAAGGASVLVLVLGHAAWTASPGAVFDALYAFNMTTYRVTTGGIHWAAVLGLTEAWRASTWIWLLRFSPLFLVGEAALLLPAWRSHDRRDLERTSLWLLAALMSLSIWYLPDFIHVSFVLPYLLLPGASVLHALRTAPAWDRLPAVRRAVTALIWLASLAVLGKGIANLAYARAIAPIQLETAFGPVRVNPEMEQLFHAVQANLVRDPDGRSWLYSYPDDAWLYLTVPGNDPTPYTVILAGIYPPARVRQVTDPLRAGRAGTVVVLRALASDSIPQLVAQEYDPVADAGPYRIYVRRAVARRFGRE